MLRYLRFTLTARSFRCQRPAVYEAVAITSKQSIIEWFSWSVLGNRRLSIGNHPKLTILSIETTSTTGTVNYSMTPSREALLKKSVQRHRAVLRDESCSIRDLF